MVEKNKVNPYYVSNLLGPLALTVAKDYDSEILSLIDYSSKEHSRLVIQYLIKPNFERLNYSTKLQVCNALAYFSSRLEIKSEVIDSKLLLCEIPPAYHQLFLEVLWESIFPGESAEAIANGFKGTVDRPLTAVQYSYEKKASITLDEMVNDLYTRLQS